MSRAIIRYMSTPRNAPCPCGSGRKYKHCCIEKQRPAADPVSLLWRRLNAVDEELAYEMMRFARRELGADVLGDAEEEFLAGSDPEDEISQADLQCLVPWMLYAWRPSAGVLPGAAETIGAAYLHRHGSRLDDLRRRYLEACLDEPFCFYQVLDTTPGEGMLVEDVMRGGRIQVSERSGSGTLERHDLLWAHLVHVEGLSLIAGCGSVPLEPADKLWMIDTAATIRGRRRRLDTADLHAHGELLREGYVSARFRRLNPRLPELQNTDGETLALQKLEFRLDDPEQALAKLAELEITSSPEEVANDAERDAGGRLVRARIMWQRRGNSKMPGWDNTILGHLAIEADKLTVEVNSNERATRVRREVEHRLGNGVRFVRGVVTSPEHAFAEARQRGELAEHSNEQDTLIEEPEVQEMLRQHLEAHYRAWADQKIPALGGKSPRQAARTADGRAKVEALLVDSERGGPLADCGLRLDAVREELGLPRDG